MRFFFERAFPQKFLHILFTGESPLGLIVEFCFLAFFRRFHPANGNLRACNLVPPAIEAARNAVFVNRRLCAEVSELLLPTLRMALFRFCHAQEDAFAFLVSFALGEVAIRLRSLHFGLPIALGYFDRLLSIPWGRRLTFAIHNVQSAGSSAALIGASTFALSCCAVITSATEPMMSAAAISVRFVKVSPAKSVPNKTATIGLTYA